MGELYDILKASGMRGSTGGGTVDAYTKAESDAKFVPKDENDTYLTINGIRLYVNPSGTPPTGDIPDGSYGLF